jgi:DNA-binding transcriptional regulator WhiA
MLNLKDQEEAIRLYTVENLSVDNVAKRLNISQWKIRDCLNRRGVKKKPFTYYRKGTLNESFFDQLNERSLWVLGWMFSDGTTFPPSTFRIVVHRDDEDVLYKIEKLIECSRNYVKRSSKKKCSHITFSSKKMHDKLVSLGCVRNKSLIVKWPDYLNTQEIWWFLRGVFEGDGSIPHIKKANYYSASIASGSKHFAHGICSFLSEQGIECYINTSSGSKLTKKD